MKTNSVVRAALHKFRPRLERLETRDCPAAPIIGAMYSEASPRWFTVAGHVEDEAPAGLCVSFSGVYAGTATVNSEGNFSLTFPPSELGALTVTVTDNENLTGSQTIYLCSNMPAISDFTAVRTVNNVWTFSGRVGDEFPAGMVVKFGGLIELQNQAATVNADGTFSLTIELPNDVCGTATAGTTDVWGQASNTAQYWVFPTI